MTDLSLSERHSPALADAVATYQKWLHLPDPSVLLTIWGTVAANRLPGDPLWLFVIGPSSSGKTEMLNPLAVAVPETRFVDQFSPASVLTSTNGGKIGGLLPDFDRADDGRPYGIIVSRDFSTFLDSGDAVHVAERFAILRSIYDGFYSRKLGTAGGTSLAWAGKAGFIAAVTDAIDRATERIAPLGQRFLMVRLPVVDRSEIARLQRARRRNNHREVEMREALGEATGRLFASLDLPAVPEEPEDPDRLDALGRFVTAARSPVERDWHREVVHVGQPERPLRLGGELYALYSGLRALGVAVTEAERIVVGVGFDSVPPDRLACFEALNVDETITTEDVAATAGLVPAVAERALVDLAAHHLVTRDANLAWAATIPAAADYRWAATGDPDQTLLDDGQRP